MTSIAKRFVSLGERFLSLSLFWASSKPDTKRRGEPVLRSGAERRVSKEDPEGASWTALRGRFAAPQGKVFAMETEGAKELRKSAANPLKSLARVNFCGQRPGLG
jgi:hypothetical protein